MGRHDQAPRTLRRPFDALADPQVVGDLATRAETAGWDGFFVIDLDRPEHLDEVTASLAGHSQRRASRRLLTYGPSRTPAPWVERGASWVLTRVGPFDLDLDEDQRIVDAGL